MATNDEKLIDAVVAKGRTVYVGKKGFGPGSKVSLPADEIKNLRMQKFLVDPDVPEVPRADGPTFGVKEGPSFRVA